MSLKPFSEVVPDKETSSQELSPTPFMEEATGGVTSQELAIQNASNTDKTNIFQKVINFLSSILGVITVVVIFTLVVVIIDAIETVKSLYISSSPIDILYLIALFLLFSTLTLLTYKNYIQIRTLKNAKKTQAFFAQQKIEPSQEIVPQALTLLETYSTSENEKLNLSVELLKERINYSQEYKEIYKDLNKNILTLVDAQAHEKIKTASMQAAISTAISPLALLDAGIIVWRSFLLTKEIAALYGFKPGWLSTLVLLKQGAFNIFFAGAAELASEYANDFAGSSLTTKISTSAGQGVTNAILIARLGFGVIKACRPLELETKRDSFMQGIYSSVKSFLSKSS